MIHDGPSASITQNLPEDDESLTVTLKPSDNCAMLLNGRDESTDVRTNATSEDSSSSDAVDDKANGRLGSFSLRMSLKSRPAIATCA